MFRINPASGKAIYEQIMEQVKEAAWKGYLKPGDASQEVDKGKMQEIKISLKEILSELRYEGYDEKKIASLIHEIYQDLEG